MAQLPAEKQRFLDEMRSFIEEEEKWLREIMQYVGWNIEDLPKIVQVRIILETLDLNSNIEKTDEI